MLIFKTLKWFFNIIFREREDLVVENLALRQQLAVFTRTGKKPKLKIQDRFFWVWLSKVWKDWPSVFLIVKPNTIIKWHRMGFRFYWRWKSRKSSPGRPKIAKEIIDLIRRMSRENITWGVPKIIAELKLLGYNIAESTVTKYMIRHTKPPSQTWRTFLKNHMHNTAAIDFFHCPYGIIQNIFLFPCSFE